MPSTDIDGSPILILSLTEAVLIDTIIEHFDVATDERFAPLAEKVGKFLDSVGGRK